MSHQMPSKYTNLESDILLWIHDETDGSVSKKISSRLIMIRLASTMHELARDEITKSLELSLNTFDRATLFRVIKQLGNRRYIQLFDRTGRAINSQLVEHSGGVSIEDGTLYLALTKEGSSEALRIKKCREVENEPIFNQAPEADGLPEKIN